MGEESPMGRLRRRAKDLGERALQELVNSDQRAEALGLAAKGVQEGRRLLDERAAKILSALGLASQADLERVNRKVGRLRKKLDALL